MDRVRFVQGCLVVGAIVLFGAVLAASIQGTVRDVETLVRVPYPGLDPATTYLGADSLPLVPLELDDSGRFVGVPDIADDQLLW